MYYIGKKNHKTISRHCVALSRLSLWVFPQTLFSFRNVSISPFFFYLSSSPFYTLVLASVLPKVDLNYTRLQQAEKAQMEIEDEDKKYLQEYQSRFDSLQKQISQKEKQLWVFYLEINSCVNIISPCFLPPFLAHNRRKPVFSFI